MKKSLFITIILQSNHNWITISDVIVYILETHSTSNSLTKKKKKKTKEKDRMKGRRRKGTRKKGKGWKGGEGEKGMERVYSEGKRDGE